MSIQLLMAQSHPSRGGGSGTGRSTTPRAGLPPLNTGVTNQPPTTTTPSSFQGLGEEALQDYTNQLAYLEEQNRLRRQMVYSERRQARSQPGSPISSLRALPTRWSPYPSEPPLPRSAVDPMTWHPETRGGGSTSGSTSTSTSGTSSTGVVGTGWMGETTLGAPLGGMSGSKSAVDPIQQYQQMLKVEQQKRIREMEEARRQRERQREWERERRFQS